MTAKEINNKAKWVLLVLIICYIGCARLLPTARAQSNANRYEFTFKVNTPSKYGHTADITGTVVKKHKETNQGVTDYFVTLVRSNTTYRIKVLEKPVYELVQERQLITFKNCIILKLKQ